MTDKNELEGQSRRNFIKKSAVVGAAATTGVAAFGGSASAQSISSIDTSNLNVNQQSGSVGGLIVVNVQNVAVQDVVDAVVNIGDISVDIQNINVLNDNTIQIAVADVLDVVAQNVQVILTVLGTTDASQQAQELVLDETTTITQ